MSGAVYAYTVHFATHVADAADDGGLDGGLPAGRRLVGFAHEVVDRLGSCGGCSPLMV